MASTLTALQNALQPATGGFHANAKVGFGIYTYGAAAVVNDVINLFVLPKNSLVIFGFLMTDDIDTGTEALEIDVGFLANGGGSATLKTNDGTVWTNAASTGAAAALVDSGVLTGDAITDLIPAGMNFRPFQLKTGPKFFSEETQVQAKITAAANAGGTGTIYVGAIYIMI